MQEQIRDLANSRDNARSDFYDRALLTPPTITGAIAALIVAGVYREKDFTSSRDPVGHSVSLYAFCPADPSAPAYASVVKEIQDASLEAALGNSRRRSQPRDLGRVNLVRSVQCVQAGLLNFASMVRSLAGAPQSMRPLLSTLCKHMALLLADPDIMEEMRMVPEEACLRAHFTLNEAQHVVSAFCRLAASTVVKSAARAASMDTRLFDGALGLAGSFQASVKALFRQDLGRMTAPVTYSEEFPTTSAVAVSKRNGARALAGQPTAKRASRSSTHHLSEAQMRHSLDSGFIRAHGDRSANMEYVKNWPTSNP